MSLLSRKPMPSFTLVLTSGSIQSNSYPSPKMLPTAPDYLMKTIDLRENSKDAFEDVFDGNADMQTIFEADRPATFDHGVEQTSDTSIKQILRLFIRKFVPYKRNFGH